MYGLDLEQDLYDIHHDLSYVRNGFGTKYSLYPSMVGSLTGSVDARVFGPGVSVGDPLL